MANSNIRSFRYDDHTESILMKFKGDNLNQKFINMVSYCFDEEKFLAKRLEQKQNEINTLEFKISEKRKELYSIDEMLRLSKELNLSIKQISDKASIFNSKL